VLKLHPYNQHGVFQRKLSPISEQSIEPIQVICPASMECETRNCNSCAILKTRTRDTSTVTFIKGTRLYSEVPVLSGHCPKCNTVYYADHEHVQQDEGQWRKLYLNSARYLKVGQSLWVDRCFSKAVLNGVYHFHASTSAFAEFWNTSFWVTQETLSRKVSQCQVWHTFVQESIRMVASGLKMDLELPDRLDINEVTKQAFEVLGEEGLIRSADGHVCSECTHEYKAAADVLPGVDDAGLAGADENQAVPAFNGRGGDEIAGTNVNAGDEAMDVDLSTDGSHSSVGNGSHNNHDNYPVKMIVMDGIVMGNHHCAFDDCTSELANAR